jgi:hypothetical protein
MSIFRKKPPRVTESRSCSYPGCKTVESSQTGILSTGTCTRHGSWSACRPHGPYVTPIDFSCPICYWESAEVQNELEADRRNTAEEHREQEAIQRYATTFRAEGYGQAAAEALARKRFREQDRPLHKWTGRDITAERREAAKQKKISAGELAPCPLCKSYAPASQGVLLSHNWRPIADESSIPCEGEGMLAAKN